MSKTGSTALPQITFIFAGVVYGVVWATDIYDRIIAKRNERKHR
jgi:hypothetical protein